MRQLRIAKQGLGEITINVEGVLEPSNEFALKALAGLQLQCMHSAKNNSKYRETLEILEIAIDRIGELYGGKNGEDFLS
jgi:hypothetical protein